MTLDEVIKHAEEVAEENQRVTDTRMLDDGWSVDAMYCDDTEAADEHIARCVECAAEHRQLAEWLKELKAHREAWGKAKRTVKAYLMLEGFGSEYQDDIEKLIDRCIPKEGDAE